MSDYAPYNAPYVLSQTYSEDFTNTQSSNEEQLQNLCKSLNYTCTPRNQLERFTEPTLTPEQAKLEKCAQFVFKRSATTLTPEDQKSTLAPAMTACMAEKFTEPTHTPEQAKLEKCAQFVFKRSATTLTPEDQKSTLAPAMTACMAKPNIERFGYPNAIYCTPGQQAPCDYEYKKQNGTRTQSDSGTGFHPQYFDDWYAAKMTPLQNKCLPALEDDCKDGCTWKGSTYAPNDKSAYDRGSKHGCIPTSNGTDHNKLGYLYWFQRYWKNV